MNNKTLVSSIIVLKQLQLLGMYALNCRNVDMKKREQGTMRPNDFMGVRIYMIATISCTYMAND